MGLETWGLALCTSDYTGTLHITFILFIGTIYHIDMVVKAESVLRCEIIDRKYTAQHTLGAEPLGT